MKTNQFFTRRELAGALGLAITILLSSSSYGQTWEREYNFGSPPNQNLRGFDCQPSDSGYFGFAMNGASATNYLLEVDGSGNVLSGYSVPSTGSDIVGKGGSFAELSSGDLLFAGVVSGDLIISVFTSAGVLVKAAQYYLSSDDVLQVMQVEVYEDASDTYVYVRGIREGAGSERHFLSCFKTGQMATTFTHNWSKTLDYFSQSNLYVSHSTYTVVGDMHVSAIDGSIYYTGPDLDNDDWNIVKFDRSTGSELGAFSMSDAVEMEPTGIVENQNGTRVYVCGFDEEDAYIARFNVNSTSGEIQSTNYKMVQLDASSIDLDFLRLHSIEYRAGTHDTKLRMVGEAQEGGAKFGIAMSASQSTSLAVADLQGHYDFVRLEELAPDGNNAFIVSGNSRVYSLNYLGLISTDGDLHTACSYDMTLPDYSEVTIVDNAYEPGEFSFIAQQFVPNPSTTSISFTESNVCSIGSKRDLSEDGMGEEAASSLVFPNPTDGMITISTDLVVDFEILNSSGQIIRKGSIDQGQTTIDLSVEPAGIYLIRSNSETIKVIKR